MKLQYKKYNGKTMLYVSLVFILCRLHAVGEVMAHKVFTFNIKYFFRDTFNMTLNKK